MSSIYGDGIAVDYKGELNATQIANYGLTLLRYGGGSKFDLRLLTCDDAMAPPT
jgi:hypothetical protein